MPISKQKNILTASCFGKMKYMYLKNAIGDSDEYVLAFGQLDSV